MWQRYNEQVLSIIMSIYSEDGERATQDALRASRAQWKLVESAQSTVNTPVTPTYAYPALPLRSEKYKSVRQSTVNSLYEKREAL